ncbi:MAG: recombination protein O N-terminal domain-containing protein [Candidatus Colwellbacteria bacterium]|nr:recombination protein O N-terminal domain-containing protein [Candidatus Colwellbacteria bacterium]
MKEYFTPGIVLEREPRNDVDESIVVYTKNLGKVRAHTKSSRKITSKLSGHLHPGRRAQIRFVERNKLHLVDALSSPQTSNLRELLPFLHFINKITPYSDADLGLWYMIEEIIEGEHFNPDVYRHLVERLGFSGGEAGCHYCGDSVSSFFNLSETTLLCALCRSRLDLKLDELIFLGKN